MRLLLRCVSGIGGAGRNEDVRLQLMSSFRLTTGTWTMHSSHFVSRRVLSSNLTTDDLAVLDHV